MDKLPHHILIQISNHLPLSSLINYFLISKKFGTLPDRLFWLNRNKFEQSKLQRIKHKKMIYENEIENMKNSIVSFGEKIRKKYEHENTNKDYTAMSGINALYFISDDLCEFLGVEQNVRLSRPDVIKMISKYIKDNNLRNISNGKIEITIDEKMRKILNLPDDMYTVSYFKLQTYLKHNFIKDKPGVSIAF